MSEQERKQNDLYVVVISTKEERKQLYDLCVKFNIPILYPELFKERKPHHLWGICKGGVGIVGTVVARNTTKSHILHSIKELEKIVQNY